MAEANRREVPDDGSDLRRRAEEHLKQYGEFDQMSPATLKRIFHELQVHQIELEMQNEELRNTQDELETARKKYFALYDLAPVGYITVGGNGIILESNLTAATLLSVKRANVIGQPLTRFIYGEDQDIYNLHLKKLLETGVAQSYELRMLKADGAPFWAYLEAAAEQDDSDADKCHIVLNDISERKQVEATNLFLSQYYWTKSGDYFFKALAQHLASNLAMDFVCIDRLVADELYAQTLAVYFDGKFEDNIEYALKDTPCGVLVDRKICCFPSKVRYLFPNDTVLQEMSAESYAGVTLFSSEGKPIGLIAVIGRTPLSSPHRAEQILKLVADRAASELERKDTEELLRQSEAFNKSIIDSSTDCIKVLDVQGRLQYMSPNGRKTLGIVDMQPFVGMHYADFWKGPVKEEVRQAIEKAKTGGHGNFRGYCPTLDGTPKWWDVSIAPILNTQQDSNSILVISRDITDRKWAEDQIKMLNDDLLERNDKLEFTNKELDAFSSSVSHDLRAPLRQMAGFAELLQKKLADDTDKTTHQYLTSIIAASRKMGMLIDDLLAFSHIGRKELQTRKVSLNSLLKEVVSEIQDELRERQVSWKIDELPDVLGDRSLLRLVLVNLVSNAVKFTSSRSQAEIKIGCKDEDDRFTCSVSDNGVGFDMKYADKLFGVFQRLHPQEEFEGTGIGLANVQRIISRHGGKVWAEGVVGQGATFYFTLPKINEGDMR
ncbi:MAG TPA: PAS domain S-box protein [Dissulfurispiraceae bacterium]|nr:PAS domain S-box protein [Dissulfurispiraceae bacterium]